MQFTVYRNANKSAVYPYLLDVQSDIMGSIWETENIVRYGYFLTISAFEKATLHS
ncbi:CcdB family protein [Lelliottia wanjuensis]|uniref:CcdB family protein n=1 Tax=Lelliottia wanjuensis TaxID=3050585 RepID=UPI0036F1DD3A